MNNEDNLPSSHGMLHSEDNLALLEGEGDTTNEDGECGICMDGFTKEDDGKIVPCVQGKGKHKFHLECIKKNIYLRHTTCPWCRGDVELPVPESELKSAYLNHIKVTMQTIERYSTFEFKQVDDMFLNSFQSDMMDLYQNVTMTPRQTKYLQKNLPSELKNLRFVYEFLPIRLETVYQPVYLISTNNFLTKLYDDYSNKRVTDLNVHEQIHRRLEVTLNQFTKIKQAWWHGLNVVSFATILLDSHRVFFRVLLPVFNSMYHAFQEFLGTTRKRKAERGAVHEPSNS